ncbi:MAG: hypothetical protein EOP04_01375 [Proteobacteria bacterium]|nr:MAG: hypothetical protein EOP04_01375 [Pseudomonadota bacterium]
MTAQLDTPIKVVMKIGSAIKKATVGKAALKLERIKEVLAGGVTYKTITRVEDVKVAAKGAFHLGAEMEQKILYGTLKNDTSKFIGAHSPRILDNSAYSITDTVKNLDGTISGKITVKIPGGAKRSKLSTLFPENWSDDKILATIRDVAGSPSVGRRGVDATLHIKIIDGVEIVVIREGEKVTSGYPSGMVGAWVEGFSQ